jgi:hypothetical protein
MATTGSIYYDDIDDDEKEEDRAETIFPYLSEWQRQSDGSLRGLIYHHSHFDDGSAIATSMIVDPAWMLMESETIVTTVTGSQYLLGPALVVSVTDWNVTPEGRLTGTVAQDYGHAALKQGQIITTEVLLHQQQQHDHHHHHPNGRLQQGDVVVGTTQDDDMLEQQQRCYYRLERPALQQPVSSLPLLHHWKRLDGGALAGFVSNHPKIVNGELVTTSPLIELDESSPDCIIVTTATGAQYQLGEPEPLKQFLVDDDDDDDETQQLDNSVIMAQNDDDSWEEYDIPTYRNTDDIPGDPSKHSQKIPLQHIFNVAATAIPPQPQQFHPFFSSSSSSQPKKNHLVTDLDFTSSSSSSHREDTATNNNSNQLFGNHTEAALEHR